MQSQPQNPDFRNNPENFHPCTAEVLFLFHVTGYDFALLR